MIKTITLDDEAYYKCEAKNIHGVASTVIELFVQSKLTSLRRNFVDRLLEHHIGDKDSVPDHISAVYTIFDLITALCA